MPKYAIYGAYVGKYFGGADLLMPGRWVRLEAAEHYETMDDVLQAVRYKEAGGPIEIHRIEETPGETRREVVELEGVVDFTGLKFAVAANYPPLKFLRPGGSLGDYWTGAGRIDRAAIFDHLADAVKYSIQYVKAGGSQDHRVVGIRETTTPATLTAIPLA